MKTKKILAIVTLVAFMISILPMAAFAAVNPSVSQFGSKVYVVTSEATADLDDEIEFEVYVGDSNGAPIKSDVFVVTNRAATDVVYVDGSSVALDETNGVYKVDASKVDNGWVKLQIRSKLAGNIKYAVGVKAGPALKSYLDGESTATVSNSGVVANGSGKYINEAVFNASDDYVITLDHDTTKETYANGSSYVEITAYLTSNNAPVAGKDVKFSINKSGATLSKDSVTTDSRGKAKVKMFATKPGIYNLKAESGDGKDDVNVTFVPISVDSIKAESATDKKVAKDESNVTLKYSFNDSQGNKIKHLAGDGTITVNDNFIKGGDFQSGPFGYTLDGGVLKSDGKAIIAGAEFRAISKPSGAKLNEKIDKNDIVSIKQDNGVLKVEFDKARFNKEGDYAIRLSLVNGKSVTYNISVKEQGDIVEMTISYDASSIPSDTGKTGKPTVKLLDAEGYESKPAAKDLKFTVDNAALVNIDTDGIIEALDEGTGIVNVTAIETKNNLVATTTVNLVKPASALKVTPASYNVVGEDARVSVQLVDVDGKNVSLGDDATITDVESKIVVLNKPTGAIVTADNTTPTTEIKEDGKYNFDIISNTAGAVKVQVVLSYKYGSAPVKTKTLTGSATVNYGAASSAQKSLTMFIGSTNYMVGGAPAVTDAAPFIENGRTFVAVRPIGDALGCTIWWDAATQTVTMEKPGETITIIVGASTFKVDRAGSVTEYPTDAPAKIKDGRTYLPFRAIGEAMGYEVNFDEVTQAVTFK